MIDILVILFVIGLILLGLAGTIIPALPGAGFILGGVILYAWHFGIDSIGWPALGAIALAAFLSFFFDYLASAYGAKQLGGTRVGVIGSIIGAIVGVIFFSLPGLILGVFAGAVVGELYVSKRPLKEALRVGWGSILGFLGGTVLKFVVGLAMVIVFVAAILL